MEFNKKFGVVLCALALCIGLASSFRVNAASTIVDVTGDDIGESISHDCESYLITKYDTNYHWKQCTICGKVFSKESHTMSGGWTLGESCSSANVYRASCSCGYSSITKNTRTHQHVGWNGNRKSHVRWCYDCNQGISSYTPHKDASDNIVNCSNPGICATCGINTSQHEGVLLWDELSNSFSAKKGEHGDCSSCGNQGIINPVASNVVHNGSTITFDISYSLAPGYSFKVIGGNDGVVYPSGAGTCSVTHSRSGNTMTEHVTATLNYAGTYQISWNGVNLQDPSGKVFSLAMFANVKAENQSPVITNFSPKNLSTVNGWVTKQQITISGTENFGNQVNITIKGEDGTSYVNDVAANISNNKWAYTFTPDIEAPTTGKKLIVTVTDLSENSTTWTYSVYSIDGIAPVCKVTDSTEQGWSKTKDYAAVCTDSGAGNVSISAVNTANYLSAVVNGNSFIKEYTFTGDIYGKREIPVYYKDWAGNVATSFLTIYNLDNTAPAITEAKADVGYGSTTITVSANDVNSKLKASGSGVVAYGISDSDDAGTVTWQSDNTFSVSKMGAYYVWAKDAVDNISKAKKVSVEIQSKVTFDAQGGKCNTEELTYDYGEKYANLPTPTKKGYDFCGWNTAIDGSGTVIKEGAPIVEVGNVHAYAQWKPSTYHVTYDYATNGGASVSIESKDTLYDTNVDLSPVAVKNGDTGAYSKDNVDGWMFVGWNTDKEAHSGLESLKMTDSDVTLYAIYKKSVRATFIDYNNSVKQQQSYTKNVYNLETSATFSEPVHHNVDGWRWRFWSKDSLAKECEPLENFNFSENTSIYGCYEKFIAVNFITKSKISSNSGIRYANSYDFSATVDPEFTAPNVSDWPGWTLVGYSQDRTCGDLQNLMQAGTKRSFSDYAYFYAVYKKPVVLTYSNYNFVGTQVTQKANEYRNCCGSRMNASFTIRDGVTKAGVEFKGWNTKKDGTGVFYSASQLADFDSDTTLYACFGKISGITLSTDTPELTVLAGERVQLSFKSDKTPLDNYDVAWSSSDTSVAEVSTDGIVTGVAPGDVTITIVYSEDVSVSLSYKVHVVSCTVSVPKEMTLFRNAPVAITFSDNNASLGALQKTANLSLLSAGNLFSKKDSSVFFELNTFAGMNGQLQPVSNGDTVLHGVISEETTNVRFQTKANPNMIPSGEYHASAVFRLDIH